MGTRGPRHAHLHGFDLHTNVWVGPTDRARVEQPCRYVLRSPRAEDRLRRLADGRVRVALKRPWSDGTRHLRVEPMECLDLGDLARGVRDEVRRLETVPGAGAVVALTTIAAFGDAQRFASAKHAASYTGLVPSTYQSASCDRHGHITKRGSAELRAMLCEAAHHTRRPSHPLHPYFINLCARRGYKMAIVAVAHRLCRILYALLRHGTEFRVGRLGVGGGRSRRPSRGSIASPPSRPDALSRREALMRHPIPPARPRRSP